MRGLGIFTAGGLARAVASHFSDRPPLFFIDEPREENERIHNIPVIPEPPIDGFWDIKYIIGCGEPNRRRVLAEKYDVPWAHLVHRTATFSTWASLKKGVVICPGVGIDPEVKIDEHVYIDYNTVIGHGSTIGKYSVIAPLVLVAGYCHVGEGVHVGAGAKIVRKARIGDNATIGAGAVVLGDVPAGEVWAGVPARRIK